MGEPTTEQRGVPNGTGIFDPVFVEWARRQGRPITRVTPVGEVTELLERYEFEKRQARQDEQEKARTTTATPVRRPPPEPRVGLEALAESRRQAAADAYLRERIRAQWKAGNPNLQAMAQREVDRASQLSRVLHNSHLFVEERQRWTFMRHFIQEVSVAFGDGELSEEQLLDLVLAEEKTYQAERKGRDEAAETAGRPSRQLAELQKWAKKQPMNPLDAFESGIAYYSIESAATKPEWMESEEAVSIGQVGDLFVIQYKTGKPLRFPAAAIDFQGKYAGAVAELIVRRHKESGRLVPFAIYERGIDLLDDLPEMDAVPKSERVLMALPRFDGNLTPLVLSYYTDEAFKLRLATGLIKVTALLAIQRGALGGLPVATRAASLTATGVRTGLSAGRTIAQNIVVTVRTYGFIPAVVHLGRNGYAYYLANAVAVNSAVVVGAEVILSLGGHDMGPMSPGDSLTIASKADELDDVARGVRSTWKAIRFEVDQIDVPTGRARAIVRSITPITDDVAEKEYELGRKVVGEMSTTGPAARGTAGRATDARSFDHPVAPAPPPVRPPVPQVPPQAQGKGVAHLAADPRPPFRVAEYEAAMTKVGQGLDRLARGTKYDAKALQAIRNLSPDAIRKSGISAADLARLANSLSRAGDVVRKFVNDFHAVPGFDRVLLTWATKHVWDPRRKVWKKAPGFARGSAYVMRYATGRLDPRHVRFEWPVSINDTKWGEEVFARHVDIVVTGGDTVKPGQQMQLELKSWTERTLAMKTRSTPGGIGYQLIRDTALFGPNNIRWVFDGKKVKRAAVLDAFLDVIRKDPYLLQQWGGKDADPAQIRALLEKVIEIY